MHEVHWAIAINLVAGAFGSVHILYQAPEGGYVLLPSSIDGILQQHGVLDAARFELICSEVGVRQPLYGDMFAYAGRVLAGHAVALANPDMVFDPLPQPSEVGCQGSGQRIHAGHPCEEGSC